MSLLFDLVDLIWCWVWNRSIRLHCCGTRKLTQVLALFSPKCTRVYIFNNKCNHMIIIIITIITSSHDHHHHCSSPMQRLSWRQWAVKWNPMLAFLYLPSLAWWWWGWWWWCWWWRWWWYWWWWWWCSVEVMARTRSEHGGIKFEQKVRVLPVMGMRESARYCRGADSQGFNIAIQPPNQSSWRSRKLRGGTYFSFRRFSKRCWANMIIFIFMSRDNLIKGQFNNCLRSTWTMWTKFWKQGYEKYAKP